LTPELFKSRTIQMLAFLFSFGILHIGQVTISLLLS
jgi:NAD-dependent DNA ligase